MNYDYHEQIITIIDVELCFLFKQGFLIKTSFFQAVSYSKRFLIYDNYLGPAKSHAICRVKLLHKYCQAPYMCCVLCCSAFPFADNEEGYVSQ